MQIGYTVNVNLFRGALMVKIITDSASDFEPNELKELMIDCIPLSVNFGDEEYKDNVTISKDEFFDKLKNTTETVKTSQPSLHDIVEEFEVAEHSKVCREIIYIRVICVKQFAHCFYLLRIF